MMWNSLFLMGGYGTYVWSCYGLTFLGLIGFAWYSRRKKKTILRMLNQPRHKA